MAKRATGQTASTTLLGLLALNGGPVPRHVASVLHGLEKGGRVVCVPHLISFFSGKEAAVGDELILYLRAVDHQPHLGPDSRARIAAVLAACRQIRCLTVVVDRSLLHSPVQRQLFLRLALMAATTPGKVRFVRLSAGPDAITGIRCDLVSADKAAHTYISAHRPAALRLSPGHVRRAMDLQQCAPRLRQRLHELETLAAEIDVNALRAARTARQLRPRSDDHPGLAKALDHKGGPSAFARHLRTIGEISSSHYSAEAPSGLSVRAQNVWTALVGDASAQWLLTPLDGPRSLSTLAWLAALLLRPKLTSLADLDCPWTSAMLKSWFETQFPEHGARPTGARILVTGSSSPGSGLEQNTWMSWHALGAAGIATACQINGAASVQHLVPKRDQLQLTGPVILHHCNADRIPQNMLHHRKAGAFHVGHLLWEFQAIPQAHRLALDMLDEIWAPSRFVAGTYRDHARCPVVWMGKAIDLPEPAPPPQGLLKSGVFTFVIAFDAHSSVARKNPLAAVRAFQAAFGHRADVQIIIKSTKAPRKHWGDPERQIDRIGHLAKTDPRIRLIEETWSFAELLGLIDGADALISSHRAEGFGYMPAYAMALGTPVVVTDYSGTRDFCTVQTALPVPGRLVPVPREQALYPMTNPMWAEVDAQALAETLNQVRDHPSHARIEAAKRLMATRYSSEALAARYRTRLEELGLLDIDAQARPAHLGVDQMFI